MKRIFLVLAGIVFIATGVLIYFGTQAPDLTPYQHLKTPAISIKKSQDMFVVKTTGDPNIVGEQAFGMLFELYYATEDLPRWPMPAPRARWPISPDEPKETWIGSYGLPVPDHVRQLPEHTPNPSLGVSLTTWEYGEVAELLYTGPYDQETPAIQRLKAFITERGYEVIGDHEEEYLKGPGMLFRGNPETYVTILRYRVRPVDAE